MSASKRKMHLKGEKMTDAKQGKAKKSIQTRLQAKHTLEITHPNTSLLEIPNEPLLGTDIVVEQVTIKTEYNMSDDEDQSETVSETPPVLFVKVEDANFVCKNETLENVKNAPTVKRKSKKNKLFNFLISIPESEKISRCEMCSQTYNPKAAGIRVREHMQKIHNNKIICTICSEEFQNLVKLRVHKQECHLSEIFECNICSAEFYFDPDLLSAHIVKKHKQKCPNYCELCKKSFESAKSMAKHNEVLHALSDHTCKICLTVFKRYAKLAQHEKVNSVNRGKNRRCKLCRKKLVAHCLMTKHLEFHHPCDSSSLYCEICKKSYDNKQELIDHNQSKHINAKYSCLRCERVFGSSRSMLEHHGRLKLKE